ARRLLPEGCITTAVDTITLHDTPLHLDLHQFDTLTTDLAHRDTLDPASATAAQQAIALYTADLLADQYDDWLIAPRELRRERYLHTLAQLAQWEKQNQRLTAALTHMLTLTQLDPLREAAHRELMRLYIALERPQDARQQFELCRQILQEELGLPPEPETQQLADTLQQNNAAQPILAPPYVPLPTPLPAYALEDSTHMPLIGRTAERRQLLTHIATTASHQRGGLIFVSGAPGVGKSRLLQELVQDAAWRGFATAWGHGKELTAVSPYGPLCDALATLLTPLRVTQLRALLAPTWLRWASTLLPQLADGTPLPDTSGADGQTRLLESLVQVVLALGELKPLLMVLEDVHWADKATFDTLHRLGARLGQVPILVVLSFREVEARENTAVWQGLTQLDTLGLRQRLHLAPLSPHDTGEFVQRGLGLTQTAPLFAQRLHRETQGSPLLLLETLRALYEEGVLYRDEGGTWHTPYDADTAAYEELTTTIESTQLIQRRVQQLPPASRHLLELAAVMGREVNFAWLNAASPHPPRTTLTHLNHLVERQFLLETAEAYQFSHDKVRQAVYNALPATTQQALHGRVASVIVAQDPTAVDILAHHFYLAQLWQEAAHYTQRAAERATRLYANEVALAQYDRLLALLADHEPLPPPQALTMQFEALLAQAMVHGHVGQIDQQQQILHQLQTLRPCLDPAQTVRLLNEQAHFWNSARNDYPRALALAQEARQQAEAAHLPHETITALMTLADTYTHMGHPEQAQPLYEQAWQRAHALPHNETQATFALRGLIRTCIELGQRADLDALLAQLIAMAEASDDPFLRGMAYGERGAANYDVGRYQEVIADFEQALIYYRQAGLIHKEAVILSNLGLAYWTLLDYRQAHRVMLAGLKTYELLENKRGILYAHNNLAELYL
ncbi:MAG: AAA family ATPase, partial [Anaerolineales bacterium]|nr:AAA family ATPase [Anaerolineales bacterium]